MNYDRYQIEDQLGAHIGNMCRHLIIEKAGHKAYDIDLEEHVWSVADSVMESMNEVIGNYIDTEIPSGGKKGV
jgi:hypothetical protein